MKESEKSLDKRAEELADRLDENLRRSAEAEAPVEDQGASEFLAALRGNDSAEVQRLFENADLSERAKLEGVLGAELTASSVRHFLLGRIVNDPALADSITPPM